jgi:zinc D-Ala-D-Ala carboxypeptidase
MNNISKYITYEEAIRSHNAKKLGIENKPNEGELVNMQLVGQRIFDIVREHFGIRIYIPSFFRCKSLNKKTPGASITSEHVQGKAIDIDGQVYGGVTNFEIFNYIKDNLEYNQLIWEFGNDNEPDWVHVSYNYSYNKKQVLKSIRGIDNKIQYLNYE